MDAARLLEAALESLDDALLILSSTTGRIVECNPAACGIFGYTRDELVGHGAGPLFVCDADRLRFRDTLYDAVRRQGYLRRFEYRMRRKDGAVFPSEHTVIQLASSEGAWLGWVHTIRDITERKQAELEEQARGRRLWRLASDLAAAEEHTRRRVAVELHDRVSQNLAAIKMKLARLDRLPTPDERRRTLDRVMAMIEQTIEDTSSLTFELSPPVLRDVGLGAAVQWLAAQVQEQHGLVGEVTACPEAESLDDDLQGMLFQMIRELMTNVVKHAHASRLWATIACRGRELAVTVRDDGTGFDASVVGRSGEKGGGFGLYSIRERLELIGGSLAVASGSGGGCVTIAVPRPAIPDGRADDDDPDPSRGRPCSGQKGVVRPG